jgi:hypothetical protein
MLMSSNICVERGTTYIGYEQSLKNVSTTVSTTTITTVATAAAAAAAATTTIIIITKNATVIAEKFVSEGQYLFL